MNYLKWPYLKFRSRYVTLTRFGHLISFKLFGYNNKYIKNVLGRNDLLRIDKGKNCISFWWCSYFIDQINIQIFHLNRFQWWSHLILVLCDFMFIICVEACFIKSKIFFRKIKVKGVTFFFWMAIWDGDWRTCPSLNLFLIFDSMVFSRANILKMYIF